MYKITTHNFKIQKPPISTDIFGFEKKLGIFVSYYEKKLHFMKLNGEIHKVIKFENFIPLKIFFYSSNKLLIANKRHVCSLNIKTEKIKKIFKGSINKFQLKGKKILIITKTLEIRYYENLNCLKKGIFNLVSPMKALRMFQEITKMDSILKRTKKLKKSSSFSSFNIPYFLRIKKEKATEINILNFIKNFSMYKKRSISVLRKRNEIIIFKNNQYIIRIKKIVFDVEITQGKVFFTTYRGVYFYDFDKSYKINTLAANKMFGKSNNLVFITFTGVFTIQFNKNLGQLDNDFGIFLTEKNQRENIDLLQNIQDYRTAIKISTKYKMDVLKNTKIAIKTIILTNNGSKKTQKKVKKILFKYNISSTLPLAKLALAKGKKAMATELIKNESNYKNMVNFSVNNKMFDNLKKFLLSTSSYKKVKFAIRKIFEKFNYHEKLIILSNPKIYIYVRNYFIKNDENQYKNFVDTYGNDEDKVNFMAGKQNIDTTIILNNKSDQVLLHFYSKFNKIKDKVEKQLDVKIETVDQLIQCLLKIEDFKNAKAIKYISEINRRKYNYLKINNFFKVENQKLIDN